MAIQTATQRTTLAQAYANAATHAALFTSTGPSTAGTATNEVTGGTYARVTITWASASASAVTNSASPAVINVPSGTTVTYAGVCSSGTAGAATVLDFAAVTSQTFASAGTYSLTLTYTQS